MTGRPPRLPRTSKRRAAAVPFSIVPDEMAISARGGEAFVELLDVVELDVEARRDLPHDAAPRHGEHTGLQQHGDVVELAAESHDVEHDHGLVVGGVVEDLQAPHLFDALADAGDHEGEPVVGEARVDAVDPQRHPRTGGGVTQWLGHGVGDDAFGVLQEDRAARHHVDPGPEDLLEVGEGLGEAVVGHGRVHDAVGVQGEQRVGVVGGGHAQGASQSGQVPGVAPDLVGVRDPHAHELEVRAGVDARQRVTADVARPPQHDPVRHEHPFSTAAGRARGRFSRGRPGGARRRRRSRRPCR